MIRVLFLITIMLSGLLGYSQNSISGKITDEKGEALVGASVFLPDLNKGVVSDVNGRYTIQGVSTGQVKIQVSYIGFNTILETIDVKKGENVFNIDLNEAVLMSQEVILIGGYTSSQHENAIKVDVLQVKEIQQMGSPNFMESLTQIPGVEMISRGQGVAKPVIRGLSMNNVLSMNNGVRMENYQYGENHPLGLDDNDIERVEVIKGPASLLYGSDAIGGVLNFIKEKPAPQGTIDAYYRLQLHSNTLGYGNSAGVKGATENFFGSIKVGQKSHGDYLQGGGEFVPNSRFNEKTLNLNLGNSNEYGTFKVYYDYFQQNLGLVVAPVLNLISERGRTNDVWYQDLDYHVLSSQNTIPIGAFNLKINGAYQKAIRKLQTTLDDPFVEMSLDTYTYESTLNSNYGKSEFIFGFQGMYQENVNLNNRQSQILPDARVNNIGLLGMYNINMFEGFKFQTGVRYDFYSTQTFEMGNVGDANYKAPLDRKFSNFNASIGATFSPREDYVFRANLAKGYRVPNISELTTEGVHGDRYEKGNPNLMPQNSYEADISMHSHGKYLSFDIAGFYNHINNYIFMEHTDQSTPSGMEIFEYAQENAVLYGGEAGVHFHPQRIPWLHLKGSYSMVIAELENGENLPFIPANKFRYEVSVEREKLGFLKAPSIKISALTALAQNNFSDHGSPTPSYTLLNLVLSSHIKVLGNKMELTLSANNILDRQYFDHLSTLKELNIYNQGRNFSLIMNYEL
jgi:iron complex outermembrane recepter protein